jgi:hypothetical protein
MDKPLKKFPLFLTDEEAEHFVDEADLSEYDFSGFKRMKFELVRRGAEGLEVAMTPSLPSLRGEGGPKGRMRGSTEVSGKVLTARSKRAISGD